MPRPIYQIVRDLEFASRAGKLTPTFIDHYASKHDEKITALYALAAKNFIEVSHEEGRNDHILTEWVSSVDMSIAAQIAEDNSTEVLRQVRAARDDGRPASLRKPTKNALYPIKHG